jgi:hypothetical protein
MGMFSGLPKIKKTKLTPPPRIVKPPKISSPFKLSKLGKKR